VYETYGEHTLQKLGVPKACNSPEVQCRDQAEGWAMTALGKYIDQARSANTHVAKTTVLILMLREVFGVELTDLLSGVEKSIKSKLLGISGRTDLLYSGVVFEIKVDLKRELDDAKAQLKKYFQLLIEAGYGERLIGIATDVIRYHAFVPVVKDGRVVDIREISSIDISQVPEEEAILWLDSYMFSQRKIRPTAVDLKFRFGPGSPTYTVAIDVLKRLYDVVKGEEDVKLKHELWSKSMEIVYGSAPKEEAFIDHTYLVTLVKLIVYLKLSGADKVDKGELQKALTGKYFADYGIVNLIEEDFFTWILHQKIVNESLELAASLAKELLRYDLTQVDEDFFKEIYQEIVERGQRHRIGEYYTPEWLTELVLREVMSMWKGESPPRILDPACGSGTFLSTALRMIKEELLQKGWRPSEVLNFVLSSVMGIDINPMAVVIARANYVIALGELLHERAGPIAIPVYVADSIRLPRVTYTLKAVGVSVYSYSVNGKYLQIPVEVAKDGERLSRVINAFKKAIDTYKSTTSEDRREVARKVFEKELQGQVTSGELNVLKGTLNSILELIDKGKNSVWVYMLSNVYMPIALSNAKFDIVVGNPPWVAMRYVENREYQEFLKGLVLNEYGLLDSTQAHLFTQIDTSTIFYVRCSDLYLRDGGIIAFVMPKSVLTGAQQHARFREFKKPRMKLAKVLDLEDVEPLFNVPSCVLISVKGGSTSYPVHAVKYEGKLPQKNVKLDEALKHLSTSYYEYRPPPITESHSYYYELFKAGASLYPRQFYFIDFVIHPKLGIDPKAPKVKTSEDLDEKEPWKGVRLEGQVEEDLIYVTVLGGDIVPFRCIRLRPVVLPVLVQGNAYRLYMPDELRKMGYIHAAEWFEKVQRLWMERATEKSKRNFPRFIDRLNYQRLLTIQDPTKKFVVLYNTTGKNLASCVIDKQKLPNISVGGVQIVPKGFIAEWKTMFYETNDEDEAYYLAAVLNSDIVNETIKPLQTKGLFGERDIVRRPLMLPIPKFDPKNPIHLKLAELGKRCSEKAAKLTLSGSVANMRENVREYLRKELEEINALVSKILKFNESVSM